MLEALITGILSAALFYVIKRLDIFDERMDRFEKNQIRLEANLAKRKTDLQPTIYLENSGIEV